MKLSQASKILGPGILFASTAIGVSHLVQSTRAGAEYGFSLVVFILAANIFKYPFFEFGSRYANSTGESIIDGYGRIGKWVLWVYFLITLASMFFVMSAVGYVTVGFMDNLLGLSALWPSFHLFPTVLLFTICVLTLTLGKYKMLDSMIKVIGFILLVSTLLAFALTIFKGRTPISEDFSAPLLNTDASILFIIALMGWMPTAVDLSTWNSLWTVEKIRSSGYHPSLKETLYEFNLGYWIAGGLSLVFVTLGAYLVYGTGEPMPDSSVGFSAKIISLYTSTIGEWSFFIIAAASFSIMFGTCIAVFDGYARAMERTTELLFLPEREAKDALNNSRIYTIVLILLSLGSFCIIAMFLKHFKTLIDLATTISFLIAPMVAYANFQLVRKFIAPQHSPPLWLQILAWAGVIFLAFFAGYFIYIKLF